MKIRKKRINYRENKNNNYITSNYSIFMSMHILTYIKWQYCKSHPIQRREKNNLLFTFKKIINLYAKLLIDQLIIIFNQG